MKKIKTKEVLTFLNSEEVFFEVLSQSKNYLQENQKFAKSLNDYMWVARSLTDLVPETLDKFGSGHIFPLVELEYELESSVSFCRMGFYKQAIIALRNVLELGMLSVYWDIDDKSHVDIQSWLGADEPTPFKREIYGQLRRHPNIKMFDDKINLFKVIKNLYGVLCNYSHTKGRVFSGCGLNQSNVNQFNEESLRTWADLFNQVVQVVVALHVLKYPVGLQFTPIDEKFGLNGPVGGFLEPGQAAKLRNIFSKDWADALQAISDEDPQAKKIAAWVEEMPDITDEEFQEQIEEQDKYWIESWGFEQWLKQERETYEDVNISAHANKENEEYCEKMRKWAIANNFLNNA